MKISIIFNDNITHTVILLWFFLPTFIIYENAKIRCENESIFPYIHIHKPPEYYPQILG